MTGAVRPQTRLGAVAARIRLTEGQLYTVAIAFAAGLVLLPSLRSLNTVAAPVFAPPVAAPATSEVATGDPSPSPEPTSAATAIALPPPEAVGATPPTVAPPVAPATPRATPAESGDEVPSPAPTAPPTPVPLIGPIDLTIDDTGPTGGLVALADGSLVVTSSGTPERLAYLTHYAADGGVIHRQFLGTSPRETVLGGVAEVDGQVLMVEANRAMVHAYDPADQTISRWAQIPDLPLCLLGSVEDCQAGAIDTEPAPVDVAATPDGTVYVTDAGQGAVWLLPADADDPVLWHASPEYGRVDGIAVDADGQVTIVTQDALPATDLRRSTVYAIADLDGVQTRTLIASSAPGEVWTDTAVLTSGDIVVTAPAAGVLVVLSPDGTSSRQVTEASGHTFESPGVVVTHDEGAIVADNGASPDEPSRIVEARLEREP